MPCTTCGGWGQSDTQTYAVRPCPDCPTRVKVAHVLHETYDSVIREEIPEDLKALLQRML